MIGAPLRRRSIVAFITVLACTSSACAETKLAVGDPCPPIVGDALDGTHVVLPAVRNGVPFVALFGFSQNGGTATEAWSHAFVKASPVAAVYAVADLSRVPGFVRGFAVAGIRKAASPVERLHLTNVLIMTQRNSWSSIVPDGSGDDAAIVAVTANGTIADIERLAYSEANAAAVEHRIAGALKP